MEGPQVVDFSNKRGNHCKIRLLKNTSQRIRKPLLYPSELRGQSVLVTKARVGS